MKIIIGIVLVVLGLVVGFIIAWAFGAGASLNLFVGILLVVAGAITGFVIEWLIDEAYRKNRELRRQFSQGVSPARPLEIDIGEQTDQTASETLSEFLHEREERVHELRSQLTDMDTKMDRLRDEFEDYQRTHPDDLTVIKGIGSVYQWKLRDAGVNTYTQLAQADARQLRRMLKIKDWQQVDIDAWIEQARDWAQRER